MALTVYGNEVSQPSRAVIWSLRIKGVAFEFVEVNPMTGETRTKEFEAINPGRTVPAIKDGNFCLGESNAILPYLADKYRWADLYPKDLKQRARVDEYLHWHHSNLRKCSELLFFPVMLHFSTGKPLSQQSYAQSIKLISCILSRFDSVFLSRSKFLAGETVTIADICAYCELDQVEVCEILPLTEYPKLSAWMAVMKKLPFHDEVRKQLFDISGMVKSARADAAISKL